MLGSVIKTLRKDAGLTQDELSQRLGEHHFKVARTTISFWENSDPDSTDPTWNPRFIRVLANIFNISEVDLMDQLGFNVIPDGYTRGDVEFALAFRQIPDHKKHRVLELLMLIMDILEED